MTSLAIFRSLGAYVLVYHTEHVLISSSPSRTREEELIYVLRQLSELRLWDETLTNTTAPNDIPSLKGLARRGDKAHLFYFFDLFVDVACSPRRPPTAWRAWTEEPGESKPMEVDARSLAKKCLKVMGSEVCTVS